MWNSQFTIIQSSSYWFWYNSYVTILFFPSFETYVYSLLKQCFRFYYFLVHKLLQTTLFPIAFLFIPLYYSECILFWLFLWPLFCFPYRVRTFLSLGNHKGYHTWIISCLDNFGGYFPCSLRRTDIVCVSGVACLYRFMAASQNPGNWSGTRCLCHQS